MNTPEVLDDELARNHAALVADNERLRRQCAALAVQIADAERGNALARDSRRAALNLMEDALEARRSASRENEERQRVEAELRDADRRKDEFLATLAHELRGPLAPVRNSLHVLRLPDTDRQTAERLHDVIERQVAHMARLVEDLMEVSRITRGRVDLRRVKTSLARIVESAIETSRPLIAAAGHTLETELPNEPVWLEVDPVRIAQVLSNLLNNAAKYTDHGGTISIGVTSDETSVKISVRDTGIGISAEMLPKVFELFTQVDGTRGRARGGLGIGLTLARSLVQLHGGTIVANSAGAGRGTELVVTLPTVEPPEGEPRRSSIPGPLARSVGRRVLVVDDNVDSMQTMALLLAHLGADVQTANDGNEALERIRSHRPELILLDIGMPRMDGHEVARRARLLPEGRAATLVAVTGWGQEEDRRRTRQAGFDQHLVKPVDMEAIERLLAATTRSS